MMYYPNSLINSDAFALLFHETHANKASVNSIKLNHWMSLSSTMLAPVFCFK